MAETLFQNEFSLLNPVLVPGQENRALVFKYSFQKNSVFKEVNDEKD